MVDVHNDPFVKSSNSTKSDAARVNSVESKSKPKTVGDHFYEATHRSDDRQDSVWHSHANGISLDEWPNLPTAKSAGARPSEGSGIAADTDMSHSAKMAATRSVEVSSTNPGGDHSHGVNSLTAGDQQDSLGRMIRGSKSMTAGANKQPPAEKPRDYSFADDNHSYKDVLSNTSNRTKDSQGLNLNSHVKRNFNRRPVDSASGKTSAFDNSRFQDGSSRNASPTRNANSGVNLFEHVKRRKTKRYYVGGFLPSVTEAEIREFVTEKGPDLKVSKVTIFRNERYNSATIRLNLVDDGFTYVVQEKYFWPQFIACRPWVTHSRYKKMRGGGNDREYHYDGDEGNTSLNRGQSSQWDSTAFQNKFSPLSSGIDY